MPCVIELLKIDFFFCPTVRLAPPWCQCNSLEDTIHDIKSKSNQSSRASNNCSILQQSKERYCTNLPQEEIFLKNSRYKIQMVTQIGTYLLRQYYYIIKLLVHAYKVFSCHDLFWKTLYCMYTTSLQSVLHPLEFSVIHTRPSRFFFFAYGRQLIHHHNMINSSIGKKCQGKNWNLI